MSPSDEGGRPRPPDRIVIDAADLVDDPPPNVPAPAAPPGLPPTRPQPGAPPGYPATPPGPPTLPPLTAPSSAGGTQKQPTPVGAAKSLGGASPSLWARLTTNALSSAVLAGLIGGVLGMLLGEVVAGPDAGDQARSHQSGPAGFTDDGSFYNGVALGTGDVQLSLTWDSTDDLDLHVIDPSGEEIFFAEPTSSSGGALDVDSNAGCMSETTTPIENVFWPDGESPDGHYVVRVHFYGECGGDSSTQDFTVTTRIGGEVSDEFNGTIGEDETVTVAEFDR